MIFAQSNIKGSLHRWTHPYGMTMTRDCGLPALGSTHGLGDRFGLDRVLLHRFRNSITTQDLHATLTRLFEGLPHRARLYLIWEVPTVQLGGLQKTHRRIG